VAPAAVWRVSCDIAQSYHLSAAIVWLTFIHAGLMNNIDLDGRAAVVTGGGKGIGLAIAQRFRASGAKVSLWDADGESLCRITGLDEFHAVEVDVTDEDKHRSINGCSRLASPCDGLACAARLSRALPRRRLGRRWDG